MRIATKTLAGIIVLAALVVVFDYTLKYSGLKIPFPVPGLEFLTFDLTGIPIVLSLLLFGLVPGTFTSAIAVLAILARSGKFISSLMKGFAEFSTILGMFIGFKITKRFKLPSAFLLGIITRVLVMTVANFALIYFGLMPIPSAYMEIPLIYLSLTAIFNVIQGSISIVGGCLIYAAIRKRIPPLTKNAAVKLETGPNS
jgi:riboflavin transporter FmnP